MILKPWKKTVEELSLELGLDLEKGLSGSEARTRLEKYGPNRLKEKGPKKPFLVFLDQFKDFIIWVLIAAAIISGFLGEWIDTAAILAIVLLNSVLGFTQELRAEKSLAALKRFFAHVSRVVRDGRVSVVNSQELVPGDIVEIEAGDNIPADGRIIRHSLNFAVEEASLTGESSPVMKTSLPLDEEGLAFADRANMIFMGTTAVTGKARMLVTATGMQTELGKIAGMLQESEREPTPLQRKLEQFGKFLVYTCFILVLCVFLLEWLRGGALVQVFLTAVSLAVAAIPEGLPAVVTIALALGVQRMVRRHVLIRKLPSVETLGSATVICSDKTGTLTRNEMAVRMVLAGETRYEVSGSGYAPFGMFTVEGAAIDPAVQPILRKTLLCGALCSSARLKKDGDRYLVVGDPTEGAILSCAGKAGLFKEEIEKEYTFLDEIPFDSERKKMTVLMKHNGEVTAYSKGAPDVLLNDCVFLESRQGTRRITDIDRQVILRETDDLAAKAMRVLGIGYRDFGKEEVPAEPGEIERNMTFVGLVAMVDPPRDEVRDAIRRCKTAGIRIIMITGDHKNVAVAIAKDLEFFKEENIALTGVELDALSDEEFLRDVERVAVYARVSPQHKLRVVRALRQKGEIVAMTGDGVNDAPAVKEADIGVAMGQSGTDVTKDVADMVITDDNFASIVAAVEEGRGIYSNIRKFVHYLLSCNAGEILVMFIASVFGMPVPLLPVQILWVNLVTDGFPALALGMDPVDPDNMNMPPRRPDERFITKRRARIIIMQGLFIAFCSLFAFFYIYYIENGGIDRARTGAFFVLTCSQLFHSFNCRSTSKSIFSLGFLSNPGLLLACVVSFALQILIMYMPVTDRIFRISPLDMKDLAIAVLFSTLPLWAMEIVKAAWRKSGRGSSRGNGYEPSVAHET